MQSYSEEDMQKMLMYQEMKHYNEIVASCFKECVRSMASKKLVPPEETCLYNCYKKITLYNDRIVLALNNLSLSKQT
ncbi:unnamed protein product [Blepharisma stoltei]|uniref:Mitochondrial import inner membrane translocase subunit n=1 Tax=Blepharisma stoltei TaxID=1481888 RepID=A0AAU9JYZ8_9CILI|nr:unnamed protein product [Blepharisma stoltei]